MTPRQMNAFPEIPKGEIVSTYDTYHDAQLAVDALARANFPVNKVSILGNDIRSVERVIGVQAMINMGVAVRLLPAKGMTLPFVSYGGSSVIAAGITVGMLLALTRNRPQGQMSDLFRSRR